MEKPRALFLIHLPPPIHGASMMNRLISESKLINASFDCDYINISLSKRLEEIGVVNFCKCFRLISYSLLTLGLLLRHKYDICFISLTCHGFGFLKDAPLVLLCKLLGCKIVIYQHNKGMARDVDKWPYRWMLPWVYKDTTVILLSWRLYPDIEKIVPIENVMVCPNGIPCVNNNYKERHNDILHLLFLSNLIESKGVIVLLDALKILKDKGYSFLCDFVGGETKKIDNKRFEFEVTYRGLAQVVSYNGVKKGPDKNKYYENADVFVFPSFYENETFGLVNIEAMSYGLPIVTTDEGGITDIVKDGENGLICKKNDPNSLADKIAVLIDDESMRLKIGKNNLKKFQENYTDKCFERNMISILNSVLKS